MEILFYPRFTRIFKLKTHFKCVTLLQTYFSNVEHAFHIEDRMFEARANFLQLFITENNPHRMTKTIEIEELRFQINERWKLES